MKILALTSTMYSDMEMKIIDMIRNQKYLLISISSISIQFQTLYFYFQHYL